jgi:hypothetical protein
MERTVDKQELTKYISQYDGHSRFLRLLAIADKNESARREALVMVMDLAIKEKKL